MQGHLITVVLVALAGTITADLADGHYLALNMDVFDGKTVVCTVNVPVVIKSGSVTFYYAYATRLCSVQYKDWTVLKQASHDLDRDNVSVEFSDQTYESHCTYAFGVTDHPVMSYTRLSIHIGAGNCVPGITAATELKYTLVKQTANVFVVYQMPVYNGESVQCHVNLPVIKESNSYSFLYKPAMDVDACNGFEVPDWKITIQPGKGTRTVVDNTYATCNGEKQHTAEITGDFPEVLEVHVKNTGCITGIDKEITLKYALFRVSSARSGSSSFLESDAVELDIAVAHGLIQPQDVHKI